MNCWPNSAVSRAANMRATMSVPPPGASGTIMRTGLSGHFVGWACAGGPGRSEREDDRAGSIRSFFLLLPRSARSPERIAHLTNAGAESRSLADAVETRLSAGRVAGESVVHFMLGGGDRNETFVCHRNGIAGCIIDHRLCTDVRLRCGLDHADRRHTRYGRTSIVSATRTGAPKTAPSSPTRARAASSSRRTRTRTSSSGPSSGPTTRRTAASSCAAPIRR